MKQPRTVNEKIILCSKWFFVSLIILLSTVYTQDWLNLNSDFFNVLIGFIGLISSLLFLATVFLLLYKYFSKYNLNFKYLDNLNKKIGLSTACRSAIFSIGCIIFFTHRLLMQLFQGK